MIRAIHALLPLLVLLTGCTHTLRLPDASAHFGPTGQLVLPAEFKDGWIIVEAKINGRGPYRLILDTGAGISGISPGTAKELGLKQRARIQILDIAGHTDLYPLTYADQFEVGGLRLEPVPLVISDIFDHIFDDSLGVVGLLGYIGLDRFTLDLDYPEEEVRLSETLLSEDEPNLIQLRRDPFDTPQIEIALLSEGGTTTHSQWFAIDSGGELMLHLPTADADHWSHRDLARPWAHGKSLSGVARDEPIGPLRGPISIGQVTIDRVVADLDTHSPLIGHRLLRQFRVRLDPRSGRATFTPADPTQTRVTAPQFAGIGVNMTILHEGRLSLISIAADSPAARAGVRPNDRVLAIDGVSITDPAFADRTGWRFNPAPQITLTIQRKDETFDVTVPTEPLFPEDLDRLRHAAPDLQPPPMQIITHPDGSTEFVFPERSIRGVIEHSSTP